MVLKNPLTLIYNFLRGQDKGKEIKNSWSAIFVWGLGKGIYFAALVK